MTGYLDEPDYNRPTREDKSDAVADEKQTRQREERRDKITGVKFEGIDPKDYPDFCDSYIVYAERGGTPLTEDELEELNDDRDTMYELLMNYLY